jgi:hypothetical protein
MQKKK